ncbi:hypothetical protein VTN00DRAFT_2996 [Thermoascus crustaceus]|uniref:uncharacterized protein n=1 Tax=Thermoascus crustaceus TaxID=5088 RepID=UPI0037441CCB
MDETKQQNAAELLTEMETMSWVVDGRWSDGERTKSGSLPAAARPSRRRGTHASTPTPPSPAFPWALQPTTGRCLCFHLQTPPFPRKGSIRLIFLLPQLSLRETSSFIMSWDGYINDNIIKTGQVDQAVLIDLTGASVWGKSAGIEISPQEMNAIAFAFNNAESAQANGIYVGGTKYIFNKINEVENIPVLHCAKGKTGIVAAKCGRSILVARYPESVPYGNAIEAMQNQAKHLIKNGL